jgi:hypothetical protein
MSRRKLLAEITAAAPWGGHNALKVGVAREILNG